MIAGLAALAGVSGRAAAAQKPYRVTLVGDSFDGTAWRTGLRIELDEGWKTYWRMPGDAGIPPLFSWKSNPGTSLIDVRYPVPGRFQDASGETVGYTHEVVFPIIVTPGGATAVRLDLDLFFAVCKDICIPVQARASIELGTAMRDAEGSRLVEDWLKTLPAPGDLVSSVTYEEDASGKPVLAFALRDKVDDIFIESATSAYFRAPEFHGDGTARVRVDNLQDFSSLKGTELKLTFRQGQSGLEQSLTLP